MLEEGDARSKATVVTIPMGAREGQHASLSKLTLPRSGMSKIIQQNASKGLDHACVWRRSACPWPLGSNWATCVLLVFLQFSAGEQSVNNVFNKLHFFLSTLFYG